MQDNSAERLFRAVNGSFTVECGGALLHSRHNPEAEAEKYVSSLVFRPELRFALLIEPGLGYITRFLRARLPGVKLITCHLSPFFADLPCETGIERAEAEWNPSCTISFRRFLEEQIPDVAGRKIALVEWRPSLRVYGALYRAAVAEALAFIREADANTRTEAVFSRRWEKNAAKNRRLVPRPGRLPFFGNRPCIAVCAGPGLEEALPLIKESKITGRERPVIAAVSSSLAALLARGVSPDIVVTSDGGNWAREHLFALERLYSQKKPLPVLLAAPVTAALPSGCAEKSETVFLEEAAFPQRGTVSAVCLDVCLAASGGDVFCAGLDLAPRGVQTHARPNALDRRHTENRFSPFYSMQFARSLAMTDSNCNKVYSSWFASRKWPARIYALGHAHQSVPFPRVNAP